MKGNIFQHTTFRLLSDFLNNHAIFWISWEALLYPLQVATIMYRNDEQYGIEMFGIEPSSCTILGVLSLSLPILLSVGAEDAVPRASRIAWKLYRSEGLTHLYRGFGAKFCAFILLNPISKAIWTLIEGKPFAEDEDVEPSTELWFQTLQVVISHPCHVVMILCVTHERTTKMKVLSAIWQQVGYAGFFIGMSERLCGMLVFYLVSSAISRLFCLRRRHARGVTEAVIMLLRDAAARTLAAPLYGLSTVHIAKYPIKL